MVESKRSLSIFFFFFFNIISVSLSSSSASQPLICPLRSPSQPWLIESPHPQCPISFSPIAPLQVDGFYLDRTLTDMRGNLYTSVLFYASHCPFSHDARLTFEALSSMFPQIQHLAVELSAAMPSIFSRYGIHSLPTILVVNQTSRIRFRGSKDIHSLVRFYQKIAGFEPVHYVDVDQYAILASSEKLEMPLWIGSSLYEIIEKEPYLLFSMLFIIVRMFFVIFPKIASRVRAFWGVCAPQLNLGIFGETSQMLGRALNMINVKRIWAQLQFCKIRNFHERTKNARVWASSLASVSLGEASSSRPTS